MGMFDVFKDAIESRKKFDEVRGDKYSYAKDALGLLVAPYGIVRGVENVMDIKEHPEEGLDALKKGAKAALLAAELASKLG